MQAIARGRRRLHPPSSEMFCRQLASTAGSAKAAGPRVVSDCQYPISDRHTSEGASKKTENQWLISSCVLFFDSATLTIWRCNRILP
jgi:hypothetical protein